MAFIDTKGTVVDTISPFGPSFTGGAVVAMGDFDGDRIDDLVVGVQGGGLPYLMILSGVGLDVIADFFAYTTGPLRI